MRATLRARPPYSNRPHCPEEHNLWYQFLMRGIISPFWRYHDMAAEASLAVCIEGKGFGDAKTLELLLLSA